MDEECQCGLNPFGMYACWGATVFGPCDYEDCGGLCAPTYDCTCDCHK